ncbi:MAG: hypothetical protein ACE5EM_11980, partial [Sphingomonadales bacterium]
MRRSIIRRFTVRQSTTRRPTTTALLPGCLAAAFALMLQAGTAAAGTDDCLAKMGDWTTPEKWVWEQICNEKDASFSEYPDGKRHWFRDDHEDEDRLLSAAFLETILLEPSYTRVIPTHGVAIGGAWFKDAV